MAGSGSVTTSLPHFPQPLLPTPQESLAKALGEQGIPPGAYPLTLSRVRTWTLSPSSRWRPHQDGEGADPGALSHQLDDTALQAAISNSRPPDRGQPHGMRILSPSLDWGKSSLFLPYLPKRGGAARPERPRQDVRKTLVSGTKQDGSVCVARHCPRGEYHQAPSPTTHKHTYHPSPRVLAITMLTRRGPNNNNTIMPATICVELLL